MQCKFWLCRSCLNVHTTLHSQRAQIQLRPWMGSSSGFAPSSDCNACSTNVQARLQCGSKDCGFSLCMACLHNSPKLEKSLEEHIGKNTTHLMLFAMYPEEWRLTQEWRIDPRIDPRISPKISPCPCLDSDRSVSICHCERCHARELLCQISPFPLPSKLISRWRYSNWDW
jgi:hypothetical protein